MGPKKRELLGSAPQQCRAYDSLTLGSVYVCVCVCVWIFYSNIFVFYSDMCVSVLCHGAIPYLGHILGVECDQKEHFSTCYTSILFSSYQPLSSIVTLT